MNAGATTGGAASRPCRSSGRSSAAGIRSTAGPARGIRTWKAGRSSRIALSRLSPKMRDVVVLRYSKGFPMSDQRVGRSPGTVASRLSRALAELEEHLRPFRLSSGDNDRPGGADVGCRRTGPKRGSAPTLRGISPSRQGRTSGEASSSLPGMPAEIAQLRTTGAAVRGLSLGRPIPPTIKPRGSPRSSGPAEPSSGVGGWLRRWEIRFAAWRRREPC